MVHACSCVSSPAAQLQGASQPFAVAQQELGFGTFSAATAMQSCGLRWLHDNFIISTWLTCAPITSKSWPCCISSCLLRVLLLDCTSQALSSWRLIPDRRELYSATAGQHSHWYTPAELIHAKTAFAAGSGSRCHTIFVLQSNWTATRRRSNAAVSASNTSRPVLPNACFAIRLCNAAWCPMH
jgi:hypothetical protein